MKKTDWDSYYSRPYKTSRYSRRITGSILMKFIRKYVKKENFTIAELGGANSCFYQMLDKNLHPGKYVVIDNNQIGLDKFAERVGKKSGILLINDDVLSLKSGCRCDLVFSIGLVEHFSVETIEKAVISHFKAAEQGGIVIISFPTPTFLYRVTRKISEFLRMWIFHDERPLEIEEVAETVRRHGDILEHKIIWPIFLTQAMIVARKK